MDAKTTRIIYGLAKELGLTGQEGNDNLHALVCEVTGKESIRQLSDSEAGAVITEIRRRIGGRQMVSQRSGRATDSMLWKQHQLANQLGWNEHELAAFIKRMAKVDRPEWQTQDDASGVIEGLKKMLRRKEVAPGVSTASRVH